MDDTQVCTRCGETKPIEAYSFRNRGTGTRHGHCKECHANYRKQHYENNKEKYKKKARRWNAENKPQRLAQVREYVFDYLLKNPCIDCGETDPLVLEFDHVRGNKRATISYLIQADAGLQAVKDEIAKCDVRCSNCHRRRHAIEREIWLVEMIANHS